VVYIRPGAAAAARQLAITLAADPDLDTDLQHWSDPSTTRPRIGILGPVTLTATGTPPRDRRARNIELATYLALHPRGVTADRVATDLWPEGAHPRPVTVRELLSAVRKWLGHNPVDGSRYMPNAEAGVYRLKSRLLDSELLRRLHKRAQAKADATDLQGALADFVQALELVRIHGEGLPIWEYTSQPYSWVATIDHPEGRQLPAMISDVSYETAELALRLGNLEVARWAAEIGHAVTPESDRPLCQLLLVAKAAGQIEVAKGLVDKILSVNDATGPEECPPWAVEAIRTVFPAPPARAFANR
jgi:DNA-binding SARP family transcriptional activator